MFNPYQVGSQRIVVAIELIELFDLCLLKGNGRLAKPHKEQ
jgi:hypothetical protein